jgi:hypothetical protein
MCQVHGITLPCGISVATMYVRSVHKYRAFWRGGNTPQTHIIISDGTPASLIARFRGFLRSLEKNAIIVSSLRHERFLPNPFQFLIHLPSYRSTVCSPVTDSVVKQRTVKKLNDLSHFNIYTSTWGGLGLSVCRFHRSQILNQSQLVMTETEHDRNILQCFSEYYSNISRQYSVHLYLQK